MTLWGDPLLRAQRQERPALWLRQERLAVRWPRAQLALWLRQEPQQVAEEHRLSQGCLHPLQRPWRETADD